MCAPSSLQASTVDTYSSQVVGLQASTVDAYSSQVVGSKDKRSFANALVVKKEKD